MCAAQATLGVFAWTEKEKPEKLVCRAAHAETAAKAKLLARVRTLVAHFASQSVRVVHDVWLC